MARASESFSRSTVMVAFSFAIPKILPTVGSDLLWSGIPPSQSTSGARTSISGALRNANPLVESHLDVFPGEPLPTSVEVSVDDQAAVLAAPGALGEGELGFRLPTRRAERGVVQER
jgi:hypothetical protein